MTPYYQDNHITHYNKDCRNMSELPDEFVQMVCTSPPYWGLRKYAGLPDLIWGNQECEHQWGSNIPVIGTEHRGNTGLRSSIGNPTTTTKNQGTSGQFCSLCGAWKGAYGLEPTPEMYVHHTIEILREVRRVLRKDGVVFWNIGDSYATSSPGTNQMRPVTWEENGQEKKRGMTRIGKVEGLKPKDLCLIPFRVAIAAQEDGWWVRSVIIWSKNNPMPESVRDRPTESHEYILMLTKNSRYYWDAEAVREKADYDGRHDTIMKPSGKYSDRNFMNDGANPNSVHTRGAERWPNQVDGVPGRNIRSVWTFPTQPYPEAHFATFPEALPERCIKAGSKEYDIVLDPFCGSGTTLWVAKKLNRRAVGYELSKEYCDLVIDRCRQQVIL